jgi:hypothetical protein
MSEYRFTRYVNGEERAEGICIKRKSNLKDAVRAAVDLVYADERPVTVLVLDDKRIAELEAEVKAWAESSEKNGTALAKARNLNAELEADVLRSDTIEEQLSDAMYTIKGLEAKLGRAKGFASRLWAEDPYAPLSHFNAAWARELLGDEE